jgi:hypothetical protein
MILRIFSSYKLIRSPSLNPDLSGEKSSGAKSGNRSFILKSDGIL